MTDPRRNSEAALTSMSGTREMHLGIFRSQPCKVMLSTILTAWMTLAGLTLASGFCPDFAFVGAARADDDDDDDDRRRFSRGRGIRLPGGIPIQLFGIGSSSRPKARRKSAGPRQGRRELVAVGLTASQIATLEQRGFRVTATRNSQTFGTSISRITPPRALSSRRALQRIRATAPTAIATRNDGFRRSAIGPFRPMGEACGSDCESFVLTGWNAAYLQCELPQVIGVIDTEVDAQHPSLSGAKVELATVRRKDRRPSDPAHGTGVVSLIVGQPGTPVVGLLPKARIVAVDAFHRSGRGDSTDVFDLVAALDVMAERTVRIVNLSLAGPDNPVLASAISRFIERGGTLVAAAGPSSGRASGYPAKYAGVIAVAAIDNGLRPSRLSARGSHIAYAGPGVGLSVASPGGKARLATGTSFAAPVVSAAFATAQIRTGADNARTFEVIRALAKDLGAPGHDPVYGWGLVQFPAPSDCRG